MRTRYGYWLVTALGLLASLASASQAASPLIASLPPSNGTVNPSRGEFRAGQIHYFTTSWSDPDGNADLKACRFHIGDITRPKSLIRNAVLVYQAQTNKILIRSDNGRRWWGGKPVGSSNVVQNRQAKVYCDRTTVTRTGNTIEVRWGVEFKPAFAGMKKIYLKARDLGGLKTALESKGAITVVAQPALNISCLDYRGRQERVCITNDGSAGQNMTGWKLHSVRGKQRYDFPSGYTLGAGATVRVTSGPDAIHNPPTDLRWTRSYMWNNKGDEAKLYDAQGNLVDSRSY